MISIKYISRPKKKSISLELEKYIKTPFANKLVSWNSQLGGSSQKKKYWFQKFPVLDAFICPSTFTFQFLCLVLQPGTLISMYHIQRLPSEKQQQEARIRKERKTRIFNPGHPPIHISSSSLKLWVFRHCLLSFTSAAPWGRPYSMAKGTVMRASLSIVSGWVPTADWYSLHLPTEYAFSFLFDQLIRTSMKTHFL